jgi:hypothetical protein
MNIADSQYSYLLPDMPSTSPISDLINISVTGVDAWVCYTTPGMFCRSVAFAVVCFLFLFFFWIIYLFWIILLIYIYKNNITNII